MKKTILFLVLVLGISFFPGAKSVLAATCTGSFSVTGSGSTYTASASGCDAANYILNVTGPSGFTPQAIPTTLITAGNYSQGISGLTVAGSYQAILSDQFGNTIGTSTFLVSTAVPITGCDAKITDPNFCTEAAACSGVPANYAACPAGYSSNAVLLSSYGCPSSKWVCIDTTAIPGGVAVGGECTGLKPCASGGYCAPNPASPGKSICVAIVAGCYGKNIFNCSAGTEQCKNTDGSAISLCCPTGKCPLISSGSGGAPKDPSSGCAAEEINTGLGCLNVTGPKTIQTILNWGVVVGGGIAFIMILIAALQINTAQGDAKRVTAGKELLFSALSGLALVALSVVLLNFLGVNILGLNTIGFTP